MQRTARKLASFRRITDDDLWRTTRRAGGLFDYGMLTSRRGSVTAPARIDRALRAGMVFMTLHFPDQVATNRLTIDVSDPKSGTAEFKACAVRVERVDQLVLQDTAH